MKREGGFTLIELMVAISVASILLVIAVPSLTTLVQSNRTSSDANALLTVILLTRSEAVRRGIDVTVCKTTDGETCSTDATVGWHSGVIVFADDDQDGALDKSEEQIQVVIPLASATRIIGNNKVSDRIRYQPNGRIRRGENGTIAIKADDEAHTKKLVISPVGRPRVEDA